MNASLLCVILPGSTEGRCEDYTRIIHTFTGVNEDRPSEIRLVAEISTADLRASRTDFGYSVRSKLLTLISRDVLSLVSSVTLLRNEKVPVGGIIRCVKNAVTL